MEFFLFNVVKQNEKFVFCYLLYNLGKKIIYICNFSTFWNISTQQNK